MKALLVQYDSETNKHEVVCESNCMHHSTAFDIVKRNILTRYPGMERDIKIHRETYTARRKIDEFITNVKLNRYTNDVYKFNWIDALITICVVNTSDIVIGEYYIICSQKSFKDIFR